jgi:hypothetical protein
MYSLNYVPLLLPHLLDRGSSMVAHLMFGFMTFASVKYGKIGKFLVVLPLGFTDSLAAWYDLARPPLTYLEISLILLTLTIIASLAILVVSGELKEFRDSLTSEFILHRVQDESR